MSLSFLKCPESPLNISSFFPPTSSHLPLLNTVSESDAPLESYSEGSHLFLPFPPVSSILGVLAFLSALPQIMLLWYLMLPKLFYLLPQSQVTFFPPSFPFVYLPNTSAAVASPASVLVNLYGLLSALSLPQKQQEARLLMSLDQFKVCASSLFFLI